MLLANAHRWASRRVVILQDAHDEEEIATSADEITALVAAWRALGLRTEFLPWETADESWCESCVVLPLLAWSYTDSPHNFTRLLQTIAESGGQPHADLCGTQWVVHKHYLLQLEADGVPTVPTVVLSADDATSASSLCEALRRMRAAGGSERAGFVIKPAIGGGGDGVERIDDDEEAEERVRSLLRKRGGDMLVQPFLGRVRDAGELAFVFINGTLLHAVRKEPCGWDATSSQPVTRIDAPASVQRIAQHALNAARARCGARPSTELYLARVDLLPAGSASGDAKASEDERWLVSEVELGWPHLFLRADPSGEATTIVAKGLLRHIGAQPGETSDRTTVPHVEVDGGTTELFPAKKRRVAGNDEIAVT